MARFLCARCGGRGTVLRPRWRLIPFFRTTVPCPDCGGDGSLVADGAEPLEGGGVLVPLRRSPRRSGSAAVKP